MNKDSLTDDNHIYQKPLQDDLRCWLHACLQQIGEITGLDHASVFVLQPGTGILLERGDWNRKEESSKLYPEESLQAYPWTSSNLTAKLPIFIKDTALLPEEAALEREMFTQSGIETAFISRQILQNETELLVVLGSSNKKGWGTRAKHRLQQITAWTWVTISKVYQQEQLLEKNQHFQDLFNYSPVAIWEEDFSQARQMILSLPCKDSNALKAYLLENPSLVTEILSAIRVVDVNETTIQLWHHRSKEQIIGNLKPTLPEENFGKWVDELVAIYENHKHHVIENQKVISAAGDLVHANLYWNVLPSHAQDWSRVLVSAVNISRQIKIEESLVESEARLRMILENADDVILLQDLDGTYLYYNGPSKYGLSSQDVVGKKPKDLHSPKVAQAFMESLVRVSRTLQPDSFEIQKTWGKETNWFSNLVYPVLSSKGELKSIGTIARNITRQKETELSLSETQKNLSNRVQELERRNHEISLLAEMLASLQFCGEVEESYKIIKPFLLQLFASYDGVLYEAESDQTTFIPRIWWGIDEVETIQFDADKCLGIHTVMHKDEPNTRQKLPCKTGNKVQAPNSLCQTYLVDGMIAGCIYLEGTQEKPATLENNQRIAQAAAEQIGLALTNIRLRIGLRQQAIHDSLTGLYNRHYLEEALSRELYRQERNGQPLSIIMMDLDHLKQINDIYGHAAGDAVLRELGKLIKRHLRVSDMPCRYGGDEFVLVMPETSIITANSRAQSIANHFRNLNIPFGTQTLGDFSVSIGIACTDLHGHTGQDLMYAADKALYQAKRAGRDQIIIAESAQTSDNQLADAGIVE